MKKKIIGTITSAILLSSVAATLPEQSVTSSPIHNEAEAEGKVINKQTLSKSQVKEMAKTMPKRQSNYKSWGTAASSLFGKVAGFPIAASVLASSASQDKTINTFKKAAKQNKKVQVITKTGPTPNLPKISYKIV